MPRTTQLTDASHESPLSITAAKRQARSECYRHRFGRQWQVVTWSPQHKAFWEHQPADHWTSQRWIADARAERTVELLAESGNIEGARRFIGTIPVAQDGAGEDRIRDCESILDEIEHPHEPCCDEA